MRAGNRRCQGRANRRRQAYLSRRAARDQEAALRGAGVTDFVFAAATRLFSCKKLTSRWSDHDRGGKTCSDRGCQCGAIRFALKAAPVKISICHCRMCQKAAGAPFASFADIEKDDFAWTAASRRHSAPLDRRARLLRRLRHPLSFRRIDGRGSRS